MNMTGEVAKVSYPGLLAEVDGAQPVGVAIAPGEGTLGVGAVLYRDDATGFYKAAAAADAAQEKYLAVLDEAADAGAAEATEGTTARAYIKGTFMKHRLVLKDAATITPAMALTLRAQGIVLKDAVNELGEPSGTLN